MREEFEKFPEIAARLSEYKIVFHDNDYAAEGYSDNTKLWIALGFVSGAWYAFQEQQKKIDKALELGYEKRGNAHYLVDEHIDEIQGLLE